MFWTTKYAPKTISEVIDPQSHYFHKDINKKLQTFIDTTDLDKIYNYPSIFLIGPQSSGKMTEAYLTLQHIFGDSIYTTRKKQIQINKYEPQNIITSLYHCEFYDTTFLHYKPHLFQKIIETLGESKNICDSNKPFYILCKNIDQWSKDYHTIIKHATEKYPETIRFILTSRKFINGLFSFFTTIRVPSPKTNEILECIHNICNIESIEYTKTIENKILQKINHSADSNYRSILLWFQEKTISGSWSNLKKIKKIELKHIINVLFSSKSITTLLELRDMLLECISFGKIEKLPRYLVEKILQNPSLSRDKKIECIFIIIKFNTRIKLHHRNHIHYEAMIYSLFHCIHSQETEKIL